MSNVQSIPSCPPRRASLIIPAHNEARVIGRLLSLLAEAAPIDLETVVVPNGCTDETAAVARSFEGVNVVETGEASKHAALLQGDRSASVFPRFYVDADTEIGRADILRLTETLDTGGVLAVAPARTMNLKDSSWPVRAYHRIWEELPAVGGLQGRGVIGVSEAGHRRLADRPHVVADDLCADSQFMPHEKTVVPSAHVVVHAPRTAEALIQRRTRAAAGNAEMGKATDGATVSTRSSVVRLLRAALNPLKWPDIAAFMIITYLARTRAQKRQGVDTPWLRDETTR